MSLSWTTPIASPGMHERPPPEAGAFFRLFIPLPSVPETAGA
jgi:hypothetical protein